MRMKLKKKRKKNLILLIILPFVIIGIISFILYNKITPLLLNYAEIESKEIAYLIIDESIDTEIIDKIDPQNLFTVTKTNNGDIQSVDFNTRMVNEILELIGKKIFFNLKKAEEGDLSIINKENSNQSSFEVPLGKIFSNPLFSNIGPKIPFKFKLAGAVSTNISTVIKNYGINNVVIEVYIDIEANIRMLLPITSHKCLINNRFLVAMKVIPGSIPKYYNSGLNSASNLLTIQ